MTTLEMIESISYAQGVLDSQEKKICGDASEILQAVVNELKDDIVKQIEKTKPSVGRPKKESKEAK